MRIPSLFGGIIAHPYAGFATFQSYFFFLLQSRNETTTVLPLLHSDIGLNVDTCKTVHLEKGDSG